MVLPCNIRIKHLFCTLNTSLAFSYYYVNSETDVLILTTKTSCSLILHIIYNYTCTCNFYMCVYILEYMEICFSLYVYEIPWLYIHYLATPPWYAMITHTHTCDSPCISSLSSSWLEPEVEWCVTAFLPAGILLPTWPLPPLVTFFFSFSPPFFSSILHWDFRGREGESRGKDKVQCVLCCVCSSRCVPYAL